MVNRDGRGHSYCGDRGEILGLLSWLWQHWILLVTNKVMGIMLGGFDRMGEGDSKNSLH